MEHNQSVSPKREKLGRWNPAEAQLFEVLVERYGKNWKRIQSFIKGRTLAQVRSHGQKFFERVGPRKTEEYERRARLIEAVEVLKLESMWVEQGKVSRERSGKQEQEGEQAVQEAIVKEQFFEEQGMARPQKSTENKAEYQSISIVQVSPVILTPIICYPRVNCNSSQRAQHVTQTLPDGLSQNH